MFIDRLLEYINYKLQQGIKKSSSAAAFGHALDMTTLLPAMLHVCHAFQAHATGIPAGTDPITESMLISARKLQDEFVRRLGRDLTVPADDNEFWHTGNPVPLHTGDYRSKRPEEWVWSAARGASAGKGTSSHEGWHAYTVRMIHSHVFKYKCNINALYNIRNMHVGIYSCTVRDLCT